jgi:uncharacterized protein
MMQSKTGYLLDINVLVALVDDSHTHHLLVGSWFNSIQGEWWGVCALTEAGFLRVMTKPKTGILNISQGTDILKRLSVQPGYRFWPILTGWSSIAPLFVGKIFGHQQVTDAILLGLAVKSGGIFVTLDKAIKHLAGGEYASSLLVLD